MNKKIIGEDEEREKVDEDTKTRNLIERNQWCDKWVQR